MEKTSVIIPAYNAEKYLAEAVASVKRSWKWDEDLLEIIVINDGSKDGTAQKAEELGCILINKENGGAASARNEGLKTATGELILLLDSDDTYADGAIEALYEAMKETDAKAVFAMSREFVSDELTDEEKSSLNARKDDYTGSLTGCSLIRREVFDTVGFFDASLRSGETVKWMMDLRESGVKTVSIPFVAQNRRIHMTNTGRVARQSEMANYAAILRARMKKR